MICLAASELTDHERRKKAARFKGDVETMVQLVNRDPKAERASRKSHAVLMAKVSLGYQGFVPHTHIKQHGPSDSGGKNEKHP